MSPQTTYKGKSSFQTYSDYLRWENFLQQQLKTLPEGSALHSEEPPTLIDFAE